MRSAPIYFSILWIIIGLGATPAFSSDLRLHFIAVGHGDAILIEVDHQALAMVDTGPPEADSIVLAYLSNIYVHRLPHLFITHTHDDHIGGLPKILDSLQVDRIHITGMIDHHELALKADGYLKSGRWPVDTLGCGDIPIKQEDITIEVLSPPKVETAGQEISPNPASMVLLVTHGANKILLTADIDRDRELKLIAQYGDKLRSRVMKASHHASPLGNCAGFLQAVSPEIIVVTVGPNRWGYPSDDTLERLHQYCATVLRTDQDGTVVLQSDGQSLSRIKP